ncbi:MAG: T9SS type A sorting domain-containing protein, partial [Chryseolinea sp.]
PRSYAKSLPVKMVDAFGREVYNASFNIGEQKKTVKTHEFASGVYIIQIKSATGEVVRKKVIISN